MTKKPKAAVAVAATLEDLVIQSTNPETFTDDCSAARIDGWTINTQNACCNADGVTYFAFATREVAPELAATRTIKAGFRLNGQQVERQPK